MLLETRFYHFQPKPEFIPSNSPPHNHEILLIDYISLVDRMILSLTLLQTWEDIVIEVIINDASYAVRSAISATTGLLCLMQEYHTTAVGGLQSVQQGACGRRDGQLAASSRGEPPHNSADTQRPRHTTSRY